MGTTIPNPVINGPYDEPARHFRFDSDGITDEIVEKRRVSEYFVPVPQTKKKGAQLQFDTEWTADRIKPNDFVNQVRARVDIWRKLGYKHVTPTTRRLLEYWADPTRENRVLFCQREAVETAIYLAEAAQKDGQLWLQGELGKINDSYNRGMPRVALKMATGSGKTVVMAMLIAWQTLNKATTPQDKRFARRFLVVAPGVTIRDRLRVLLPEHDGNYYLARDLVPADLKPHLASAKIVIVNYHVFLPKVTREGAGLASATKALLLGGKDNAVDPFTESPAQVAARVAREFDLRTGEVVVLNDEAHHCYQDKTEDPVETEIDTDERDEVKDREETARVWFKGLLGLRNRLGLKYVYDLSATPFFLNGSGYGQGTLFPWVVSDFSLVDAIECGIVKVPRLPVDDDAEGEAVVFRHLYDEIRDELPKRVARTPRVRVTAPQPPDELAMALRVLYDRYAKAFAAWESDGKPRGETPPVFIVVCNNTTVSKLVYDWVAGYEKASTDLAGNEVTVWCRGELDLFDNVENETRLHPHPRTIIVDSAQLESGEQLSDDFKKLAAAEIEAFKDEIRQRFPGRDPDALTEADLLREVMNTVGKPGKLGADVRCVVSVSMLTEGWDANTVTHILGVRAFRTPLLTEQVVGRGLRRRSYDVNEDGLFDPEYAEIFGVPFAFIPASGPTKDPKPRRAPVRVHAVPERVGLRIVFPRLIGYRLELPDPGMRANLEAPECRLLVDRGVPAETHIGDLTGFDEVVYSSYLREMRIQEVAYKLAHRFLDVEYRDQFNNPRPWLFPKILAVVKEWLAGAVEYSPGRYPGMLLLPDLTERCVEKLRHCVVDQAAPTPRLLPVFDSDKEGSTDEVDFDTTRVAHPTDETRCPISHVVADSGWEVTLAQLLEELPGVASYVKNDHLGFAIPYTYEGRGARYVPDFLVRLAPATDSPDEMPRTLIVEVSGGAKKHHAAGAVGEKADTTRNLWCRAVNDHGGWGLWGYVEIGDLASDRAAVVAALDALRTSGEGA
ncbi:MAG: BPTD_3080 family restriction endonuclease [Sporichthyaceae bacterium]